MTAKEIQVALFEYFRERGYLYFSSNTNAFEHEADFVAVTSIKIAVECEIKRSRSDFFADFKKDLKHKLLQSKKYPISQFYFACEEGLIRKEEVPFPYGLMYIKKSKNKLTNKNYVVSVAKNAKKIHNNPISDYLLIKLLTSVSYKWFNLLKSSQEEKDKREIENVENRTRNEN